MFKPGKVSGSVPAFNYPVKRMLNQRCRNRKYPETDIERCFVEGTDVPWHRGCPDYEVKFYDSPKLEGKPWADPAFETSEFKMIKFNVKDGDVDRTSHMGNYRIEENGLPRNPIGRTGIAGRGLLGRWGPNHAADPIVTRWRRDQNGLVMKNPSTKCRYLQMCAIKRKDCGQWAIPGGMVDPGELVTTTLLREFTEEALSNNARPLEVEAFFKLGGKEVYRGYVDDPRNTDNAWIETVAMNFHDDTGELVGRFNLQAGDDAARVMWRDVDRNVNLYANHSTMVKAVVQKLKAHW